MGLAKSEPILTVGLRERVTASVCECVFVCGAAPKTQQTTTKTKREETGVTKRRERINVRLGRVREDKGSEGR